MDRECIKGDIIRIWGWNFVVVDTQRMEDGYGHGEHDVYPGELKVTCHRLNKNMELHRKRIFIFIQSGCHNGAISPESISHLGIWNFYYNSRMA